MPVPELPFIPAPHLIHALPWRAGYATHGLGRGHLHIHGHIELLGADSDRGRFRVELGLIDRNQVALAGGLDPKQSSLKFQFFPDRGGNIFSYDSPMRILERGPQNKI